jgi:hypothetical protein
LYLGPDLKTEIAGVLGRFEYFGETVWETSEALDSFYYKDLADQF